jgi:phosphoribosylaminoimidazolecarboxamide formyltransferase/IMP cyclohydrolase
MESLEAMKYKPIDMVIVNLYPFFEKAALDIGEEEKIEFIDIGGPTMLRSAAKNFADVIVVTDVGDYEPVRKAIEAKGDLSLPERRRLAAKVFNLTAAYDAAVSAFLSDDEYPPYYTISCRLDRRLRYGENPHQDASLYLSLTAEGAFSDYELLQGKELSYNNIRDADSAWKAVSSFEEVACVVVKHNNPCGAALGAKPAEAYKKAHDADPVSIYGGVVSFNREVDGATAMELAKVFLEVIAAPSFSVAALHILGGRRNLRLLKLSRKPGDKREISSIDGGYLVQGRDDRLTEELTCVTQRKPTPAELDELLFGMRIVTHVKSNAIVVSRERTAVGIAGGQTSRVWAATQAISRGKGATCLASDAFFPFPDVVEEAHRGGITAIMQPGGSVRDEESIEACDRLGIAMVFSGIRHFRH